MGFWNTKTGRMEIMALLYAFKDIPQHLWNIWIPNISKVRPLLVERINDRLQGMKTIRYNGNIVDYNNIKLNNRYKN